MRRSRTSSRSPARPQAALDYPLQDTVLDLPTNQVLALSAVKRKKYIRELIDGLVIEIDNGTMALKRRVPFKDEMRDLRALVRTPADRYLRLDERSKRLYVLASRAPGYSHTYWSRHQMWKMTTKQGSLDAKLRKHDATLVGRLERLFDPNNAGKAAFRTSDSAILNALNHLQMNFSVGAAFPPFHAKLIAEKFLPTEGECLVVDPCAGWGGRLLGTLCVNRTGVVRYVGIDPEKRNRDAYEGLTRRVTTWLKREIAGPRESKIHYRPFEDWIGTASAKMLFGKADLVITSPPYFDAENYNTGNRKSSANRYTSYKKWREGFYRPLVKGAFDLLKPGGVFALNIANVQGANRLEDDARKLARDAGFAPSGHFYKLAMSKMPGTTKNLRHETLVGGVRWKHEPVFVFQKPRVETSDRNES